MAVWTTKLGVLAVSSLLAAAMTSCGGGGGGQAAIDAPTPTSTSTTSTTATTTSTTLDGGGLYTVSFGLDDAITVGSLQLELDYGGADGGFAGSGASVTCASRLPGGGGLVVFSDVDASAQLNFAMLAPAGFTGPAALANCTFIASGAVPAPGDFVITVLEANAVDGSAIAPVPAVSVSAVAPQ